MTSPVSSWVSVPRGPLTTIWPALIVASTPLGSSTGYLAIRDIWLISLGHVAQHFAADACSAGLAISHDTTRGGHNGHAQTVHDLRNGLGTLVDAQTGTGHAIDTLDHGLAGVVLQGDFELRLGFAVDLEVFNVAFFLQHSSNSCLQLGGGHGDRRFVDLLRVAHAGQHVGDGIAHAHVCISYQLALVMPGTSPRIAISRNL